jgi:integrase
MKRTPSPRQGRHREVGFEGSRRRHCEARHTKGVEGSFPWDECARRWCCRSVVSSPKGLEKSGACQSASTHLEHYPPILKETLEEIRQEQRDEKVVSIDGHVFTWQGKQLGQQGWKRSWATACRNAKLEDLRFHDLRHTFVTRKVREGWDYKRIMAITGHKTFAVFQRYNNPTKEDLRGWSPLPRQPHQHESVGKLLANGLTRLEAASAK